MSDEKKIALIDFIKQHVSVVSETYKNACLKYFNAITSGKEEDYKSYADASLEHDKIYANKDDFAQIKSFMDMEEIDDATLKRELEMLFLSYQAKQIDETKLAALVDLQNKIESNFAKFRTEIDGKQYTDNEIEEILATSTDSETVKKARIGSKSIGNMVAHDIIKIVKMRNDVAHEL